MRPGGRNPTPYELEASGILDGLGLEIVRPTNSTVTCTAGRHGSLIEHVIIAKGYRNIVKTCEVVREAPCGTHLGVRPTLAADPANIHAKTLPRPKSLEAAVDHSKAKDLVTPGCPVPSWGRAWPKTNRRARAHVLAHTIDGIGAYLQELGIEK